MVQCIFKLSLTVLELRAVKVSVARDKDFCLKTFIKFLNWSAMFGRPSVAGHPLNEQIFPLLKVQDEFTVAAIRSCPE